MSRPVRGFTLVEIIVAVGIFSLFVLGIYGGIQLVFKVVNQSRIKIIESAILNEQLEIIRNLPYESVGIVNGSPSGILTREVAIIRNNLDFLVTRTIRNIDDEFDGTIGGEPNDTSPADYKLVEVSVNCVRCEQRVPLAMQTYVAPKNLEGDPTHGALFIEVFDSGGVAVPGAEVHVLATTTDPQIDLVDTTDNNGMLRIVDLGAGMGAYHITVSKDGYTSDQTIIPTVANPSPVKPPASVVAQNVTEISFSIDHISTINLNTINSLCQPVLNVDFNLRGTRLIGNEPDVYLINRNEITDGNGQYNFNLLPWDVYGLSINDYDILGVIPLLPFSLLPGVDLPVKAVLGVNSDRSLLVIATDGSTGQPIANAVVNVVSDGYNQTKLTGVGSSNQTNWSGGDGQLNFVDETAYFLGNGVDNNNPDGDLKLSEIAGNYVWSGELESSIFYFGDGINYVGLNWEPLAQPVATGENSLKFQIATSDTSTTVDWNYFGPDGTNATYYNAENTSINIIHNNQGYFRYKAYLSTETATSTPILSDLAVVYTNSCTPPGQAYFGSLLAGDYTVTINADGYQQYTATITIGGDQFLTAELRVE